MDMQRYALYQHQIQIQARQANFTVQSVEPGAILIFVNSVAGDIYFAVSVEFYCCNFLNFSFY